ncbi:MAG: glycosyl hydrolase 53 family protein [Bacteroidota bacterium]
MRISSILLLLAFGLSILAFGCKPDPEIPPKEEEPQDSIPQALAFITGMDMSYQPMLEDEGVAFFDEAGGKIPQMMPYLAGNGVNLIRLRLFHTPDPNDRVMAASSLDKVMTQARLAKTEGIDWLLDIHYSDTWADPGSQTLPAAWEGLGFAELEDSVYHYTLNVLTQLAQTDLLPSMVQIGNETNDGFLWDQGRAWGNFPNYARLVKAGLRAVEEVETQKQTEIKTMIHLSGVLGKASFLDSLFLQNVEYDLIGLSHYSRWHTKDLQALGQEIALLAKLHRKPILLVETAYPWTLDWNDWTNNIVGGADQLVDGYPATPAGQRDYLQALVNVLKGVEEGRGLGVVWWAPDYVAFDGEQSQDGSPWENMTTFDFEHKALPVLDVFRNN